MLTLELGRIVFLVGALVALNYKSRVGVTPGGIIVPGIFALLLFTGIVPFIYLLLMGWLCHILSKYLFRRFALTRPLYNALTVFLSALLHVIAFYLFPEIRLFNQELLIMSVVVPGLTAINMNKYGVKKVIVSILLCSIVAYMFGALVQAIIPLQLLSEGTFRLGNYKDFPIRYMVLLVLPVLALEIFVLYKFKLKSGGYTALAIIAIITILSPIQAIMIILSIILCVISVKLAMKFTDIIGLEKFVLCLVFAYFLVTVMDTIAMNFNLGDYRVSAAIIMTSIAIIANDLCVQPIKETLAKATIPVYIFAVILAWIII